jgi:prophage maintenance system killer protein
VPTKRLNYRRIKLYLYLNQGSLRWQADRIDHLSDQMSKAESLLEKLNQTNKNHKST